MFLLMYNKYVYHIIISVKFHTYQEVQYSKASWVYEGLVTRLGYQVLNQGTFTTLSQNIISLYTLMTTRRNTEIYEFNDVDHITFFFNIIAIFKLLCPLNTAM